MPKLKIIATFVYKVCVGYILGAVIVVTTVILSSLEPLGPGTYVGHTKFEVFGYEIVTIHYLEEIPDER